MARNWYDSVVPEDAAPAPCEIDVSVAHPARVYDYWLGGQDNFAADRAAAKRVLKAKPGIRDNVRANRRFLTRAVRFLAAEAGVQQFLDIGTGIPAANNTHEVTQAVRPEARVGASSPRSWTRSRPASHLVLSHPARDVEADRSAKAAGRYNQHVVAPMRRRTGTSWPGSWTAWKSPDPGWC